ncbi:hypothetical protein [Pedobacter sp. ASV28]|uniref:hypothetical protein n=1 Tax=Pedobacter sp. ASV28 TaxID=2795123 RepID=UPI0018EB1FD9|nr:hypothetical protein [Pedobacter sp. ASV28]
MKQQDGLDHVKRLLRVQKERKLAVLDTNLNALMAQAYQFSGFLRYYNLKHQPDGHFDRLLKAFKNPDLLVEEADKNNASGHFEPAMAILLIFLENLNKTTQQFSQRWKEYPEWYLKYILAVEPLPVKGNKVWLGLQKDPNEIVTVKEGTRFITRNEQDEPLYYTSLNDISLTNASLIGAYVINLEKDHRKVPEKYLQLATAVRVTPLRTEQNPVSNMSNVLKTLGIKITSPSLLLKDGLRMVTITIFSEEEWMTDMVQKIYELRELKRRKPNLKSLEYEGAISEKIFDNIFFLTISTTEGWKNIYRYTVTRDKIGKGLKLSFTLDEKFPPTERCTLEKHKFTSKYPKLNLHLNFEAWMYPYSWIKDLKINKILIRTEVSNSSNVQVYNELGKVDSSKPFAPFGISNKKGSWFALGNYEMAIKNTKTVSVDMRWIQLPDNETGLLGYYAPYGQNIDNTSFKLRTYYLADFDWKASKENADQYLFATHNSSINQSPVNNAKLYRKTCLANIDVTKMPPIKISEEEYEYNQLARSGFIELVLQSPEMGFGESVYHKRFTELMMKSARKDQKYPELNPPISPLIDRITLSYVAEDIIDPFHINEESAVDYILPLDDLTNFPLHIDNPITFAAPLDEVNVLIGLQNAAPGHLLNVFFEFEPSQEETAKNDQPIIQWYIGHMRKWKAVSQDYFVQIDETMHLSLTGRIQFFLPEKIDASLYDHHGHLWIRAGISSQQTNLFLLKSISLNPVLLQLDTTVMAPNTSFTKVKAELEPEKNIPGIIAWRPLSPFFEGRTKETDNDMLIRISEHITHLGKAVTPRDYERIILQVFADIGKAKCYNEIINKKNMVTIAVLPASYSEKPLVANYAMVKMERFLQRINSSYADHIKITNPNYEEVMIRMNLEFKESYFSKKRRKKILDLVNNCIAPWQDQQVLPQFGYVVSITNMYQQISEEFGTEITIKNFQAICFGKHPNSYRVIDYEEERRITEEVTIAPAQPHTIFIPSKEHILHIEQPNQPFSATFGIEEMKLGNTFIIK